MEKAAISLAVSVVSPILKKLGEIAAPYFGGGITDADLKIVQKLYLPVFQTILQNADDIPVDTLKPWLMTLQDACFEAEDLFDMYEYKRLKYEVSSRHRYVEKFLKEAREFVAPITLKTNLRKSMENLQKSYDEAKELFPVLTMNQVKALAKETSKEEAQPQTVSSTSSPVFGRDNQRDDLIDKLISVAEQRNNTEEKVPIYAIYGIGGGGKTTLAQFVYNDSRVEKHFEERIWVHISRKFDVHMITTNIMEQIKGQGFTHINSLDVLQSNVKKQLRSERFQSKRLLVILDDVWCVNKAQWNQMLIPFNDVGGLDCRIVITARTKKVVKTLDVKHPFPLPELQPHDFLCAFKHYSFGDAEYDKDKEFLEIAEKIVNKLHKSPLAAMMVGSLLKQNFSISYWEEILNQDVLKYIRGTLYLSFQQLPLHLRRCFAFCSLYPKGYEFQMDDQLYGFKKNLVLQWISQGFVEAPESNESITLEGKGMQYFNELVSYSFFKKIEHYYVIHDLLHDLAQKVTEEHYFRVESGGPTTIPKNVMHLSIGPYRPHSISLILSQIFERPNLRTFLVLPWIYAGELGDEFIHKCSEKLKKLRMLYLRDLEVKELPKSIGKLKYLRYLQLGRVEKLPESLGGLYHLQYLYFGYATIDKVPESLNNLINLRACNPGKMLSSIPCLKKLSHLQHCEYSISNIKRQQGMDQLKHLQEVQRLSINNLENVKNKGETSEASLKDKKFLNKLRLKWEELSDGNGRNDEEVAESLEPPPNLSEIQIDGYNGVDFPTWLQNDQHFSHLSALFIESCSKVKQLLTLPATLKYLRISSCENLCEVSRLPPNLENLFIQRCPGFEEMLSNILLFDVDHEEKEEEQKQHQHQLQPFRLIELTIIDCSSKGEKMFIFDPKAALFPYLSILFLYSLPWLTSVHLEHNLTYLKSVDIGKCENLELFRSSLASTTSSVKELTIQRCPMLARKQRKATGTIKEWCFENLLINDPSLLAALVSSTSENCLTSLKKLEFCMAVIFSPEEEDLLQHPTFPSLLQLEFSDCYNLPSLPLNLHTLSSLTSLRIIRCPKIESLPNLPASLKQLYIDWAPELKRNYGEGGPLYHQISHIPHLEIY